MLEGLSDNFSDLPSGNVDFVGNKYCRFFKSTTFGGLFKYLR